MDLDEIIQEGLGSSSELNEALGDKAKDLGNKLKEVLKKTYNAAKTAIIKVGNRAFGVFRTKNSFGITNAKGVELIRTTEQSKSGLTMYGIGLTNGTKISGVKSESKDMFGTLTKILSEVETPKEFAVNVDVTDRYSADQEKTDKRDAFRKVQAAASQLKDVKIDQDAILDTPGKEEDINTVSVPEMAKLYGRLAFQVKFRTNKSQFIPSILVFGSPGEAKTAIGSWVAKLFKARYKSIEVGSIYTEIFGGMPVSQEVYDGDPETGQPSAKSTVEGMERFSVGNMLFEGKKSDKKAANRKYNFVQQVLTGSTDVVKQLQDSKERALLANLQAIYLKRTLTGKWDSQYKKIKNELKKLGYTFQGEASAKNEGKYYSGVEQRLDEASGRKTKKIVELVPVKGVLPDPDNDDPWILALDEFSRSGKKMSAVMNLLLTGAIGTIYFLPLKTIVAATSNMGTAGRQINSDGEQVESITGAMLTRFNYVVRVQAKLNDALEHVISNMFDMEVPGEEETEKEAWEIDRKQFDVSPELAKKWKQMIPPSLWLNFAYVKPSFEGNNRTRIQLKSFQNAVDVKLNPRLMETIGRNIAMAALQDWESGNLVQPVGLAKKRDKSWYEKHYKDKKYKTWDFKNETQKEEYLPSPQAYYLLLNQGNKRYLDEIRYSVMESSKDILPDLARAKEDTVKKATLGDTRKILSNYILTYLSAKDDPDKYEELKDIASSAATYFQDTIPRELTKIGSEEKLKALISEDKKVRELIKKEFEGITDVQWLALNIGRFVQEASITDNEVSGIAIGIGDELVKQSENEEVSNFLIQVIGTLNQMDQFQGVFNDMDAIAAGALDIGDMSGGGDIDDLESDLFGESRVFESAWNHLKRLNEKEDKMAGMVTSKPIKHLDAFNKGFNIFYKKYLDLAKENGVLDKFRALVDKQPGDKKVIKAFQGIRAAVNSDLLDPIKVGKEKRKKEKEKKSKADMKEAYIEDGLKKLLESM